MTFTLKIDCDNAAFDDPDREVARILRETAAQLEDGGHNRCKDVNGNTVGSFGFSTRRRPRHA